MRASVTLLIGASIGLGLGATSVYSQSLGEVAATEKERRKGEAKRVVTEEDLAKGSRRAPATEADSGATASSDSSSRSTPSAAASDTPEKDPRAEAQKNWEKRRQQADAEVARLTTRVEELQQAVGDQSVDQYGANRVRRMEELKQAQDKLAAAQQKLDDLEEERRREGY
jgi:ElaB/YqjD/DUF883 family membrane-anchored ribosome-binding protein